MKMDVHDEHGMDRVELEIIRPVPIDAREWWTLRLTFVNKFEAVVKLDRHDLKDMLSMLIGSL